LGIQLKVREVYLGKENIPPPSSDYYKGRISRTFLLVDLIRHLKYKSV